MADGCDSLEEVLSILFAGSWEGLDENDLGGRLRMGSIETLNADRHGTDLLRVEIDCRFSQRKESCSDSEVASQWWKLSYIWAGTSWHDAYSRDIAYAFIRCGLKLTMFTAAV